MNIHVDGATLKSLRGRYKASLEVAAKKINIDPEQLHQWEEAGVDLSITEAKKIAQAFHSHWSILLLHTEIKPIHEPVNHRAGYSDNSPFSSETLRAYEVARKLLDASEEIEGQTLMPRLNPIRHLGQSGVEPTLIAQKIRVLMNVSSNDIRSIKGGAPAVYEFWKDHVSMLGIYISEQSMPETETKAFLLKDGEKAVIVVNKKDRYIYSRIFSLLHELGHLMKGESSAACIVNAYTTRTSPDETWCNRFASELAAYDEDVMADSVVDTIKSSSEPAKIISRLSHKYKVSFTVMLYKLKKHNKVTIQQCSEMKAFFENVILPRSYPALDPSKEIRLGRAFYVKKDLTKASVGLAREVMERQSQGTITYREAASLLDTKAKYLEDIKQAVGFGS